MPETMNAEMFKPLKQLLIVDNTLLPFGTLRIY